MPELSMSLALTSVLAARVDCAQRRLLLRMAAPVRGAATTAGPGAAVAVVAARAG